MSQIKIPGATNGACNNFDTENPQILGSTVQKLFVWRPGEQDLYTPVLHLWTIIRLGDLATWICAPLSYTYERFFDWATLRPGFVRPYPIPMNYFSPGRSGDQGLCTPVLYLWTIFRLGNLATRVCALLSYIYVRLFALATWRPGFLHPCPIPMNDFSPGRPGDQDFCTPVLYLWTIIRPGDQYLCTLIPYLWTIFRLGYLATRICAPLSHTYERFFDWATWRPGFVHPCPIPMND